MLKLRLKSVEPEAAAARLFGDLIDPEQIWSDVRQLPPCQASAAVACCEVAFVRIAIIDFLLEKLQPEPVRARMSASLHAQMRSGFRTGDLDTEEFYGCGLADAAAAALKAYAPLAPNAASVTGHLMERLGCEPAGVLQASRMFVRFGNDAVAKIRASRIAR